MIKRALDSGAHGIMVPMCHDGEQAGRIANASKYAPQGTRGCGSPFTQQIFGVPEATYEAECNDNLLTIVQIESAAGVENVAAIAGTKNIDVSPNPQVSDPHLRPQRPLTIGLVRGPL